jgi:hypothetical protein
MAAGRKSEREDPDDRGKTIYAHLTQIGGSDATIRGASPSIVAKNAKVPATLRVFHDPLADVTVSSTSNTHPSVRHLPNARLSIYPDAATRFSSSIRKSSPVK